MSICRAHGWQLLLLLALGPGSAAAAGPPAQGGEAHHEAWHHYAWEFASVETAMLVLMLVLAICFEFFWHHLAHHLEHTSYKFGSENHEVPPYEHKQLYTVLLMRVGHEFMCLGFLALLVFLFERKGIFYKLTMIESDDIHLPKTELDWFHMAEIVHFSLFFGMCLYFVMMTFFVAGSIRDIRIWENIRTAEVTLLRSKTKIQRAASRPDTLGNVPDKVQYHMMQDRFITGVLTWQTDGQKWNKLLEHLSRDPEASSPSQIQDLVDETFRSQRFDFSAFLALNVQTAVEDAIQVHVSSWIIVWLFLAVVGFPCHYFLHLGFSTVAFGAVLLPSVLWLILCLIVFKRMQGILAEKSHRMHDNPDESSCQDAEASVWPCLDRFFFSGHHLMRFAQVAGFLVSYVISRWAFEAPEWEEHFELALATTLLLGVVYLVLCFWYYYQAPLFLGLMSLPPKFNRYNEQSMWDLLAYGAKHHVVETHMTKIVTEHAEIQPAILRQQYMLPIVSV